VNASVSACCGMEQIARGAARKHQSGILRRPATGRDGLAQPHFASQRERNPPSKQTRRGAGAAIRFPGKLDACRGLFGRNCLATGVGGADPRHMVVLIRAVK